VRGRPYRHPIALDRLMLEMLVADAARTRLRPPRVPTSR
jgi:hypothetical protein